MYSNNIMHKTQNSRCSKTTGMKSNMQSFQTIHCVNVNK